MECTEITQPAVAIEIMQTRRDERLQKLFNCLYALFQGRFLQWIMHRYSHSPQKDKLWDDAKDAFQNGLLALYRKAQRKEFGIKGSLKTTVFSFGLLQLLAMFKKEKSATKRYTEFFFDNYWPEIEQHILLNKRENDLIEAFKTLPQKQRSILILKFFDGLPSKQIAERLGVSAGNVDNETTKAYAALRCLLQTKSSFQKEPQ